ncbi:prolyl oligopeptidase family serine peptidase [Actinophytocola algeriensis]|uniref:Putative esterase n=1 Tax=Actinophytocola algeriensis TaxID=1768010 RepID=A0A7W7Q1B0_9PSEU|nr:prolyl oligopeptidase family serine peptidase [Actinophytocola algeriensis]MBB4905028.1 putative esterase [Actinophytocola algeriensis]MBE1476112.1 putative esterase [Actinophytocola algeriensis]
MKVLLAATLVAGLLSPAEAPSHVEGTLPGGATYVLDVPADWNRTVLLYSHGYTPDGAPNPAQNAPNAAVRSALLARGYALAGSSYRDTGWVLEHALPDQLATLDTFADRFGKPRRAIAWGTSLGGMITTGLAERHGPRFAGALAMCGLEQGGIANWNNTLDPVFAVRTFFSDPAVPLVHLPDQATALASVATLTAALDAAQATPRGRARTALAAALHNLPRPGHLDALRGTVYVGLSWRQEMETWAGGNPSWNTGVDYARVFARSANRAEVEALYDAAGLSLTDDLALLNRAPRISAAPGAVRYVARNLTFTGRPATPLLTIHTTGDALVPVQVERAYADAVHAAGRDRSLRQAFVDRAGHCTFTDGEMLAALAAVERRADSGRWPDTGPSALNAAAAGFDPEGAHAYARYRPAPYPRPFDLARATAPRIPAYRRRTASRSARGRDPERKSHSRDRGTPEIQTTGEHRQFRPACGGVVDNRRETPWI